MKMLGAGAAAAVLMIAPAAMAQCGYGDGAGYVFVATSCIQGRPGCDTGRDGQSVLFISNVIRDDGRNRRFPAGIFFTEMRNQHGMTMNGDVSACYQTRGEASDARRRRMARYRDGVVRNVWMPDT